MLLRALHDDSADLDTAWRLVQVAARAVTGSTGEPGDGPEAATRFRSRVRHLAQTDPGGAWLAEGEDGRPLGVAVALRREGLWGLSVLAVPPGAETAGRALLERTMGYGAAALRGVVCTPAGAPARTLRAAGFRLHPTMRLVGEVDRATLEPARWVREGGPGDADAADAVDWITRGAPHGPDHALLAAQHPMLLGESPTGRGYCYLQAGAPCLLAATDVPTARGLLTEALARSRPGARVSIEAVTAEQDWAVETAVRHGLHVLNAGFVCLRGMRPPSPYLPSPEFL